MSPLRSIARWSAGPAIGIALGLVLGSVGSERSTDKSRSVRLPISAADDAMALDLIALQAGTLTAAGDLALSLKLTDTLEYLKNYKIRQIYP